MCYVSVVTECPRASTCGRDRDFVFVREFSAFVRAIKKFVYVATEVPAEYELEKILSVGQSELCSIDVERFQTLFGQYFQFDVSRQRSYFYQEVQKFLSELCIALLSEYYYGRAVRLNLTPFDPVLVNKGSKDRFVDSLLDSCLLLS